MPRLLASLTTLDYQREGVCLHALPFLPFRRTPVSGAEVINQEVISMEFHRILN